MKIFIGTPVRDSVKIDYHISMTETVSGFELSNIDYQIEYTIGNPYIDGARNELVRRFMNSDCSHLLFIDSDISWSIEDIRHLINNNHLDIVGGIYPKKTIKKFPVIDENNIGLLDNSMFFPEEEIVDTNIPIKVKHLPTGFMMISRKVFEAFQKNYSDRIYYEDGIQKFLYFSCELVKEEAVHYGEDINFCRMAKLMGFECYIIPAIQLAHIGDIQYKTHLKV